MAFRCTAATLIFSIATTGLFSAEETKSLPREIHGDWVAVVLEFSGQRPPEDIVRKYKVTVQANQIAFSPLNIIDGKFDTEGKPLELKCEIDPATSPKSIDLILKEGTETYRMLGIYDDSGKQLKICWQHDGKARPKAFKTEDRQPQMLVVLERSAP